MRDQAADKTIPEMICLFFRNHAGAIHGHHEVDPLRWGGMPEAEPGKEMRRSAL